MRKYLVPFLFLLPVLVIIAQGCRKDGTPEDKSLYEEVNNTAGYSYYKKDYLMRLSSKESDHNPYFRVRFNSIAFAALTDKGKLPAGGVFPDGSVVVAELYDVNPGYTKIFAVMKKSTSENAVNGWLWAEFQPDASTVYSVTKKGADCAGCHSNNSRDGVRLFNQFP